MESKEIYTRRKKIPFALAFLSLLQQGSSFSKVLVPAKKEKRMRTVMLQIEGRYPRGRLKGGVYSMHYSNHKIESTKGFYDNLIANN